MARPSGPLGPAGFVVLCASIAFARRGFAQERPRNASVFQKSVPAPQHALEIGVAGGYSQGVGSLGGTIAPHVQDIAGVGVGGEASIAYRASPHFSLGAYGTAAFFTAFKPITNAKSMTAGLRAGVHFRPYRSFDPWMTLGAGYRVFSDSLAGEEATVRQAIQAFRLGVGVDYRPSATFSIGPFVAGDLSLFLRETLPNQPSTSISGLSSFFSAGISAHFDLTGDYDHPATDIATR
jgi:hypothetical protein